MPYKLYKDGSKTCVRNSETGESKGCSDTRGKAVAHMRALYAAEGGAKMGKKEIDEIEDLVTKEVNRYNAEFPPTEDELKELEQLKPKHYTDYLEYHMDYVPYGIHTFAELDAWREAQHDAYEIRKDGDAFMSVVGNIMANPDIKNKAKAVKDLADEFSSRMGEAVTSDSKKETDSADQPAPVDAGENTFANKPVSKIKSRIDLAIAKLKEVFGYDDLIEDSDTPHGGVDEETFTWYDKETGKWRWLTRYSNHFRDRDKPPEIISTDSHRRFVERVEKGLAPYPEAWIWHIKSWKIGTATWVAYDDSGFALAAGDYDEGCEQVAEWLSKQKGWRVSHGMPPHTIKRDPNDPSIIIEHETREISFLPGEAAANMLTDFISLKKEDEMAIPADKKKTLIESWGMPADLLEKIEASNAETAEKAAAAGLESKEVKDETADAEKPASTQETSPQDNSAASPSDTEQPVNEEFLNGTPTRKEVVESFAGILTAQEERVNQRVEGLETAVKSLTEQVGTLVKALAEKEKSTTEAAQDAIKSTPMASLAALLTPSVIGAKETQVDGRSDLAKSKPKETSPTVESTGIPFIDRLLAAPQIVPQDEL